MNRSLSRLSRVGQLLLGCVLLGSLWGAGRDYWFSTHPAAAQTQARLARPLARTDSTTVTVIEFAAQQSAQYLIRHDIAANSPAAAQRDSETAPLPNPPAVPARAAAGSWLQQTSNTTNQLNAVHFNSELQGWAVGLNATIRRTINGGTNWLTVSNDILPNNGLNAVRLLASGAVWVGGVQALVLTGVNGGTFLQPAAVSPDFTRHSTFPVSDATVWAAGFGMLNAPGLGVVTGSGFVRSRLSGSSLIEQIKSVTLDGPIMRDIYMVDFNTGWAVGDSGRITKITNADSNVVSNLPAFNGQSSGVTQTLNGLFMLNLNTGWVVGNAGVILKTTNGGDNWMKLTSNVTSHLRDVHFVDANRGWVVGDGGVILSTADGGASWMAETSGVSADLRSVHFFNANAGYAVGASGTILKRLNCNFALSATNTNVSGSGGTGTVNVTSDGGCNWTAASNANWLTITSGASGAGNGTVNFTAAANPAADARTGTLTIAGQTFTVNQAGGLVCPTVSSLSPTRGTVGSTVIVTGTNLDTVTAVRFAGGVTAQFTPNSATSLTATVPAGATTGPLTISKTGCPDVPTASFTICAPLSITPVTLPEGPGGVTYNQTLTASGGTAPYSFAITAGALPGGLTLTTGGVLAGTPNVAGTFNFTVTTTDANGCTGTRSYTVNVTVTLGAQTRALYVLMECQFCPNQVFGYAVNEATGALTLLSGFPISTGGNGAADTARERLTIDRTNQRLYVINEASDTVSAYSINATTGALTPLPFSPLSLGSGFWRTIAVHPGGSPLVIGTGTTVNPMLLSYRITATTATAALGSPYATGSALPAATAFSQDGNYVYTGGGDGNTIAGFSVNPVTGSLTPLPNLPFNSGGNGPVAYATDTLGRLFIAEESGGSVRAFTTINGGPSAVSGNPFSCGLNGARHGLLHPNGFYLVADSGSSKVGVCRINGSNNLTSLAAVTGSPFASGGLGTGVLALNQTGMFLFAANSHSGNLTTFSINPSTGALTALATQPANTLGAGNLAGMAYFAQPCPTITVAPTTLPNGTIGTAYNQTLTASPVGNYNYAVTAGSLPAGLSLNPITGAITGTPTRAGTVIFEISALSFGPCSGKQAYALTISSLPPVIDSLSPVFAIAGGASFTLTVNGANFVNNSVVFWNGSGRSTTFISNTQLTAQIPASDIALAGTANVTVSSPAPGGGTSSAQSFAINNPVPTLSGLTPNSTNVGGQNLTLTATGTNFVNGARARWNGNERTTTFVNSTQLTISLGAADLATAGTAQVTVLNPAPGGGASNALPFITNNTAPSLLNLTPTVVVVGAAAFTLTVNGSNFVSDSVVRWNGNNRATTFVSATRLTAAIPASDIAAAGTARVTVYNGPPGGGASSEATLTIANALANVSAASFSAAEFAGESIVSAFGAALATRVETAAITPLPTELAGTTVKVRDSVGVEQLAPLFFVAPTQINYLIPTGLALGAVTITVTSDNGTLSVGTIQLAAVAPGLFSANANGQGVAAAVALRVKNDGAQSFEPVARFDEAAGRFVTVPIDLGLEGEQVFLILFGTGFRAVSALTNVVARIGGTNAEVLFVGAQGGAGLDQANVRLPRSLTGRGEMDLLLLAEGKTANTVRIAIK